MRATSITVHMSSKVNLGNYDSTSAYVGMTAELDAGEDPATALATLRQRVGEEVLTTLRESAAVKEGAEQQIETDRAGRRKAAALERAAQRERRTEAAGCNLDDDIPW